jgi:peroxidase
MEYLITSGYNTYRKFCKLENAKTFDDTLNEIQDPENRRVLKELYDDDPNLVELWVAGIAETPSDGGVVGPTLRCVVGEQFRRARDGDRFFYENKGIFSPRQVQEIKKTSISRIFCDNLKEIVSIQKNAFRSSINQPRPSCAEIPTMSLCAWKGKTIVITCYK